MTTRRQTIAAVAHQMARHGIDFVTASHELHGDAARYVEKLHDAGGRPWILFVNACKREAKKTAAGYALAGPA